MSEPTTDTDARMHWADQMALEVRDRVQNDPLLTGIVERQGLLVYDEKTPSGVIHIGSGRGWLIHDAIAKALRRIGLPAQFVLSSDDYDPFDRPLPNMDAGKWNRYLGVPFCDIPSPVEGFASYGDYFFRQATARFAEVGITCAFESTADNYRKGVFNSQIKTILDNATKVQAVYLDLYGPESEAAKKMPFNMRCPACGRIATTVADQWDAAKGLLHFRCMNGVVAWAEGCGYEGWGSPYDGGGKFPWKVEWAAKWPARGVIVEFGGKDHFSKGGSRTCANRIAVDVLGYPPPYPSVGHETGPGYEFFQVGGAKMSTSKGTGMSFSDGVDFFPGPVLRYLLLRHKPVSVVNFDPAKNDVILLCDAFDRTERLRHGAEEADAGERAIHTRLYELCAQDGAPAAMPPQVPLPLASTMLQVALSEEGAVALLQRLGHLPAELSAADRQAVAGRLGFARRWLERFASEAFLFRLVDESRACDRLSADQCAIVEAFCAFLDAQAEGGDAKALHDAVFAFARERNMEHKALFQALYLALIAKDRGPLLAAFLLAVGLRKSAGLMRLSLARSRQALAGKTGP